jgi:plasmid stability protein
MASVERLVPLTVRLPEELHRKLRFVAADRESSLNGLLISLLEEALEGARVSVPSDLLSPGSPRR